MFCRVPGHIQRILTIHYLCSLPYFPLVKIYQVKRETNWILKVSDFTRSTCVEVGKSSQCHCCPPSLKNASGMPMCASVALSVIIIVSTVAGSVDWVMLQSCLGHHFMLVLEKQEKFDGHQQFFAIVQLVGTRKQADNFAYRYTFYPLLIVRYKDNFHLNLDWN